MIPLLNIFLLDFSQAFDFIAMFRNIRLIIIRLKPLFSIVPVLSKSVRQRIRMDVHFFRNVLVKPFLLQDFQDSVEFFIKCILTLYIFLVSAHENPPFRNLLMA
ncbi:hypothetical protein A1A1_04377 [Planococcus antarcticus DSM 14505]|uniref:Uncharacterized protein n=1 Tax=Planococcus antarcticus DSM 14505 TaxID=1185653 RepID=A0AA87LVZ3_9BACL|nr:hypothetical protein A1A1_04377 [Planococcus antarcticus DSM 14505]